MIGVGHPRYDILTAREQNDKNICRKSATPHFTTDDALHFIVHVQCYFFYCMNLEQAV
jgi:hypothetical protein